MPPYKPNARLRHPQKRGWGLHLPTADCMGRSVRMRSSCTGTGWDRMPSTRAAREEGGAMPRKQRLTWTVVLRSPWSWTGFASLVVLGGGTALWLVEGERPDSTIHSWADALVVAHHLDDGWLWRPCSGISDGSSDCRRCHGDGSGSHWCRGGDRGSCGGSSGRSRRSWHLKQQRKFWSSASTCASLGSRHSWLVWMPACTHGQRSQSMTPFAVDETISSGWTGSTSPNQAGLCGWASARAASDLRSRAAMAGGVPTRTR